jgi:hypothetical protein
MCLLTLAGCSPAGQSQPPAAAVVTATTAPKPAVASNPTAAPKPTAAPSPVAAKPTATAPATSPATAASPKPAVKDAASKPAASASTAPAVVATSVAGLPAVAASPTPPGPTSRGMPADVLGVGASAGSAATATSVDAEATALCGPGAILSSRASQAAGRSATVAIERVAASYQPSVRGQPTFLNDAPFPNHRFTAVIWGNDRPQFQPAPESWQGKALCVSGPVEVFQQRPQIVVTAPSQLRAVR